MTWLRIALALVATSSIVALVGCGGDDFESSPPSPTDSGSEAGSDAAIPDAISETFEVGTDAAAEVSSTLPLGAECDQEAQCASGSCVDGVCCEEACGDCSVCNAPGQAGKCTPVEAGDNPDDVCGLSGEPCAGACDGAGACAYPAEGTPCGADTCTAGGGALTSPQCDGAGVCEERILPCDPYACDTTTATCFPSCEGNPDACAPNAYCDGSACIGKLVAGEPCSQPDMCDSGWCVDGVCCDGPCSEPCESCAQAGHEGSCTPFAQGEDPEGECVGQDPLCAGACSGASQCAYPDTSTPCGTTFCDDSDNIQWDMRCDGSGTCQNVENDCGLFVCNDTTGACVSSCTQHDECVDEAYCDGDSCLEKSDNAALCDMGYQCLSGHCEMTSDDRRCCNTECPLPMDCVTGECLCHGVVCPGTEACVPWYQDLDQDTFGDPSTTVLGCEGTAPKDVNGNDYVRNMDDCYDLNPSAHPGQESWFEVQRGDNSFDYDCDAVEEKEYDDTIAGASSCHDCKNFACHNCGYLSSTYGTYGYTCQNPCGPSIWQSFKQDRPCGQSGTLHSCNHLPNVCTSTEISVPNTVQRCK